MPHLHSIYWTQSRSKSDFNKSKVRLNANVHAVKSMFSCDTWGVRASLLHWTEESESILIYYNQAIPNVKSVEIKWDPRIFLGEWYV